MLNEDITLNIGCFFVFAIEHTQAKKLSFPWITQVKLYTDVNPSTDVVNSICNTLLIMRKMRKTDQQNIWLDVPWY